MPPSAHRPRKEMLTWRTSCKPCKLDSALKIWSSQSSGSGVKQQQPMLPASLVNPSQTRMRSRRGSRPCRPPHATCCWLRCAVLTKDHRLPAAHPTNCHKALPATIMQAVLTGTAGYVTGNGQHTKPSHLEHTEICPDTGSDTSTEHEQHVCL